MEEKNITEINTDLLMRNRNKWLRIGNVAFKLKNFAAKSSALHRKSFHVLLLFVPFGKHCFYARFSVAVFKRTRFRAALKPFKFYRKNRFTLCIVPRLFFCALFAAAQIS